MSALKLMAGDAEDLETIAAFLQDAVVPMSEMGFQSVERRFALVASRFRWEVAGGERVEGRIYERIRCGVRFEHVTSVKLRDLDQHRRGDMLSLLTITPGEGVIDLVFAAGGLVRLEVERIDCHLEDIAEPWPTQWRPAHPEDATDG